MLKDFIKTPVWGGVFNPDRAFVVIFLAVLISAAAMSIDVFLPALPAMAKELNTTYGVAQFAITIYTAAYACAQIVHGPLLDRYGRRAVLLASSMMYLGATVFCIFAPSIDTLLTARVIQAFAGAASFVSARAIARDLYLGHRMTQVLAYVTAIMAIVPIVAPIIGSQLQRFFGWRSTFGFMLVFSFLSFLMILLTFRETLNIGSRSSIRLYNIFRIYGTLLRTPRFLGYAFVCLFGFSIFLSYITGASFVFQHIYKVPLNHFGYVFALGIFGYVGGNLILGRFSRALGVRVIILLGVFFAFLASAFLVVVFLENWGLWGVVCGASLAGFGMAFLMTQAVTSALEPFAEIAGSASALLGFVQTMGATLIGVFVGTHVVRGDAYMILTMAGASCMAGVMMTWLYLTDKKNARADLRESASEERSRETSIAQNA